MCFMKNKSRIWTVISIIFVLILCICACSGKNEKNADNFNFKLNFGVAGGKNCIDTYNGTFTKDLIDNGTETIEFTIPNDKMQEIYKAFLEYNIFALPNDVSGKPIMRPEYTFIFSYTWGDETRTIVCDEADLNVIWAEDNRIPDTHKRMVKFAYIIVEYIYGTEEYQKMPLSEGGYA